MKTNAHRRNHAEVAAASSKGPKQVLVLRIIRPHKSSISQDKFGGEQVIHTKPKAGGKRSITASQKKTGHAYGAYISSYRSEAVRACCVGHIRSRGSPRNRSHLQE